MTTQLVLMSTSLERNHEFVRYRKLKIFLAYTVAKKCRIYQIFSIGAFLHAVSRNKTYTVLPEEWKELFPDLEQWFGVPLLLLKSVYGVVDGPQNWDDTLEDSLLLPRKIVRKILLTYRPSKMNLVSNTHQR